MLMKTGLSALLGTAIAAVAPSVLLADTPPPSSGVQCTITQATNVAGDGIAGVPEISGNGEYVVFASMADLTGDNPDHNAEIFRVTWKVPVIEQITDTAGFLVSNSQPSVSANGGRIVFLSNAGLAGTGTDNVDVIAWAPSRVGVGKSTFTAVTKTANPVVNYSPTISGAGDRVVYESGATIGRDLFMWSPITKVTEQLTSTDTGAVRYPVVSNDGTSVAFSSTRTFGTLNTNSSYEVFVMTIEGRSVRAVTHDAQSIEPALGTTGDRVVYLSEDGAAGANPDSSSEVFLGQTTAGTRTPISSSNEGLDGPGAPTMNADASRIVYATDEDQGADPDYGMMEIVIHDIGEHGATETRLTDALQTSLWPSIDDSGQFIAFMSAANLTGSNSDLDPELFIATCALPAKAATCDGSLVTVTLSDGQKPTTLNDVIRGTSGADVVSALGGDDRFCGGKGNDVFRGGGGWDRAFGGPGRDTLRGQTGNDRLVGGKGKDRCVGGVGNDTSSGCELKATIP